MPNNTQQSSLLSSSRYDHRGQCTPDRDRCRRCFRYWCSRCGRGLGGMWERCYICEQVQEEPVQEEPVQEELDSTPPPPQQTHLVASRYWHEGECLPDSDRCHRCFRYWCAWCGIGLSGMMSRCDRCT